MENSTSHCMFGFDSATTIFLGTLLGCCVIFLLITVIVTICRTTALHNNTNFLLASINVSDLLNAITLILYSSAYIPSLRKYIDNKYILDLFVLAMSCSGYYSAVIHLTVIAIDRYLYILKPFYYIKHMNKSQITKILFAVWIFTLVLFITPIVFFRNDKYHRKCIITNPPVEYYFTGVAIGCVCFIVVCVCYFRIACVAFQRKKARNSRRQQQETANDAVLSRINRKAAMKSVKFFVAMFGTYFFCFIPSLIITLLNILSVKKPAYISILSVLGFYVHIIINLFIYLNMSKDFRLGMKHQFSQCLCGCCKKN